MARRLAPALLALVVLAGCGGDDSSSPPSASAAAKPVGHESAGSSVQFADCGDWRAGTRDEKMATIVALRGQLTPQRSKSAASPFPDESAFAMFERACEPAFSESFRLYKLYARAQGFAPLSE